ncbi:MAG TPA: hypothetical protein VK483_17085 [Chitinophagaceae bacterium]|nr:hypothetical protein [Chitinophagaceae bacterium]
MKKIILSLVLFFTAGTVFSQTFMHGAGVTVIVATADNSDASVGEGLTYFPRFNFIETESLSVSAGIPISVAISVSTGYYDYYYGGYYDPSIGLVVNAPLIIDLNMGRGSTKDNRDKFGFFVGAGFGYHHGDFLMTDEFGYTVSESTNGFGPAANAGLRFGVGRKHQNVEVNFSYMKGLSDNKPNIFGVGCAFNF